MKRLLPQFQGPWAYLAGGAFALLAIGAAANFGSLRGWFAPAEPAQPELRWVADPGQYPPALLRVADHVPPAGIHFDAIDASPVDPPLEPRQPRAWLAGYDEQQDAHSEGRSVLRRLPSVETPRAVESSLPPDEWKDERLPEFTNLDPSFPDTAPQTTAIPVYPGAGGTFQEDFRPPQPVAPREATTRLPTLELPQASSAPIERPAPVVASPVAAKPEVHRQPELSQLPARRVSPTTMKTVSERANELSRHGFSLAERGAFYSARAEFVQALRLITQALDGERGEMMHSRALSAGLKALDEAEDFIPKGSRLEADLDVPAIVSAHETPVLKTFTGRAMPLAAVQRYYTFAQQQLAIAGGEQPAASAALYGLARVYLARAKESADARQLAGPKAMTLHQAALTIDPRNHRAANELGVLLARYGQLSEARQVLLAGLATSRQRETWHNLAVVHERLGEGDLARRAKYEEQLLKTGGPASAPSDSLVRWMNPREFAATANNADAAAPAVPTRVAAAPQTPEKKSSGFSWPWK